jgi:ribonuclease J
MKLTIHRGSHEVGGNCVEIETGNTRLILDAGMPLFGPDREPYDGLGLQKKTKEQLRALGILPDVTGLFGDGPKPTAILLSHAHQDHTGLLHHSHPEIPIYASRGTSKMMAAGAKFAGQPYLPRNRHSEFQSGKPQQVGDVLVTPFSVDHSIYGAMAFLLEAEGKRVLYSGDLRLHGRKPGMAKTLLAAIHDKRIDVLLMEGTHIASDYRGATEFELEDSITEAIHSAPGLVLASFSPQHVDRLVAFLKATQRTGRTFIADAYTGYILHLIGSEISTPSPISTEWIRIFFPKFFRESYERKRLKNVFSLLSPANRELSEILQHSDRYVMIFRPTMLESDFEGTLPQNARCIYSRWGGYLEQPDWQPVKAALHQANGDLIELHTSGHIFGPDIADFIASVNPKLVIPVHTFEPDRFSLINANTKVLAKGETFTVD